MPIVWQPGGASVSCPRYAEDCEKAEFYVGCKGDQAAYKRYCRTWISENETFTVKITQKVLSQTCTIKNNKPFLSFYFTVLEQQSKSVRHTSKNTESFLQPNNSLVTLSSSTLKKIILDMYSTASTRFMPKLEFWSLTCSEREKENQASS